MFEPLRGEVHGEDGQDQLRTRDGVGDPPSGVSCKGCRVLCLGLRGSEGFRPSSVSGNAPEPKGLLRLLLCGLLGAVNHSCVGFAGVHG